MLFSTMADSVQYIKRLCEDHFVTVIWHGGEPTLADIVELKAITVELLGVGASVTMTTNMTYDDEKAEQLIPLFRLFRDVQSKDVVIQTSWDIGDTRFYNEAVRDQWERNVLKVKDEIWGVEIQPIVCLTKELIQHSPMEIFKYFSEKLHLTRMNFDRLTLNEGRIKVNSDIVPTNAELDDWLCNAYQINENEFKLQIPLFEELEYAVAYKEHIGCRARECSKYVRTINPDGTIATCPDAHSLIIGSVFDSFYEDPKALGGVCLQEGCQREQCYTCENFPSCNGDCYRLPWDSTGCPGLPKLQKVIKEENEIPCC